MTFASVLAGFAPPVSFYEEVETRLKAVPGVIQTSFVSIAPWAGRNSTTVREVDGTPVLITGDIRDDPARRVVMPEYFTALDIALVRGRVLGVNPRDPFALIVVSLLLLVAAVGAIWIPARRAAALDPLASLRFE